MKLIMCKFCSDVVRLTFKMRHCECGASFGQYDPEDIESLQAEIGGSAIPLGFENNSFVDALRNQPSEGRGERFTAFVIPKECPTIRRV